MCKFNLNFNAPNSLLNFLFANIRALLEKQSKAHNARQTFSRNARYVFHVLLQPLLIITLT